MIKCLRNSINETQNCTLKDNNFKHIIKIPFVGKVSCEFKNKLTKLFSHHLRVDISPVFTTLKLSSFFLSEVQDPQAHQL